MGLFDLFKKKKVELTEAQLKWNKMWELWSQGNAESPYAELMTYQSEINNGGHSQYFYNVDSIGNLSQEISVLETVLSDKLVDNLHKAYKAHLILDENEDDNAEEILEQCDNVFYDNEEEINAKLKAYATNVSV